MPRAALLTSSLFRFGMFHRRLLVVAALIVVAFSAIGARLFSLTVTEGEERHAEAESRLGRSRLLPTIRGRIIDRKGRVLAEDVPAYGLAVEYSAIDGTWARNEARRLAREELGRTTWSGLTRRGRDAAIERVLPHAQSRLDATLTQACALVSVPRAEVDERIARIAEAVDRRASAVRERQLEQWMAQHGRDSAESFRPEPIREERQAHEVLSEISDAEAFALRRLADEVPGIIAVTDSVRRSTPWSVATVTIDRSTLPRPLRHATPITIELDGVADHLVGRCRTDVWREDLERRPFLSADGDVDLGGYRPGSDLIGHSGIERSQEDVLRGTRGRVTTRIDTGDEDRVEPVAGRDVELAIDIALEARIEALLDPRMGLTLRHAWHEVANEEDEERLSGLAPGTPLAAAAVVIDVDRGEILACATWPPLAESARLGRAEAERLAPGVNRAIEGNYSPGSILKPLVYLAAAAEGAFPTEGTVECTGHFFSENPNVARCWIYRPRYGMSTHTDRSGGALGAEEALARSCNIFFYTAAQKLGPERLTAWLRRFGLGAPLGIGLLREVRAADGSVRFVGESAGILPNEEALVRIRTARDSMTPIMLGIGQGPIAWTPLQAANAYAMLAREGVVRDAVLVRRPSLGATEAPRADLPLPPRAVQHMLEGLRQAVESTYGTANHLTYGDQSREKIFDIPGIRVHGKTGTAQAPPLRLDLDGDGIIDRSIGDLDHAWFAGLVGDARREQPRYAIAVLVEYGGSGGKVAGPIAAQVIRSLITEGYLEASGAAKGGKN